jgi:hypothetical protein
MQLNADADFFRHLNCLDYSLLVAKQKLHDTEKNGHKKLENIPRMASLVSRLKS